GRSTFCPSHQFNPDQRRLWPADCCLPGWAMPTQPTDHSQLPQSFGHAFPGGPEAGAGGLDEVNFFAVRECVPPFFELGGVVALGCLSEVAVLEVDRFDLLLRQLTRYVGDVEPPLGGAVHQV